MKTLITGSAGFIGSNLIKFIQADGLDLHDATYVGSILDLKFLDKVFQNKYDLVIHLAAIPGVREPNKVLQGDVNIRGFFNILTMCKKYKVKHLMYASSSSVYGSQTHQSENTKDLYPISYYACTKLSDEVLANTFSKDMKITGLRFFTVYGPNSRPDMAIQKFIKLLKEQKPVTINACSRDFTYITDIVKGIKLLSNRKGEGHEIFNIGTGISVPVITLFNMISLRLMELGYKLNSPIKFSKPPQEDVECTCADTTKLYKELNWKPSVMIGSGIKLTIK